MKNLRVYIHIPFCKSKCQYCDFNSYANKNYLIDSYINALCHEIDLSNNKIKNKNITSIFIGGGTPSFIDSNYIKSILEKFEIGNDTEVTIEINPGTVDKNKLIEYKNMGINRVSFGVQSLNNNLLKLMGRVHDKKTAIENIKLAYEVGFKNISVDLMFGYPTQTLEVYKDTLNEILTLSIQHISCYSLKIEENTMLDKMINRKILQLPLEKTDRDMYHLTEKILNENSIFQYEISNYAKIGYECKHNIGYWELDEYIGFGISAHSYFENKRFSNIDSIGEYIREIGQNRLCITNIEEIDLNESKKEYIILGLRLNKGINIKKYYELFKVQFELEYKTEIRYCMDLKLLNYKNNVYSLTDKGKDLSNSVFVKFI